MSSAYKGLSSSGTITKVASIKTPNIVVPQNDDNDDSKEENVEED